MISVKSNSVIEDSDTAEVSNKILSWFFCQGLQVYDLEEQQTALNTLLGLIEKKSFENLEMAILLRGTSVLFSHIKSKVPDVTKMDLDQMINLFRDMIQDEDENIKLSSQ